jgi:arrestin-related trafficking adapter 3/6
MLYLPVGLIFSLCCQCRCTPESTSLPRYHELLHEHSTTKPPSCPCEIKNRTSAETGDFCSRGLFNGLDRISSRLFTDPASTVDSNPFHHLTLQRGDSLYDLNTQFERLVSGQESELGEAPPTYKVLGRLSTVR